MSGAHTRARATAPSTVAPGMTARVTAVVVGLVAVLVIGAAHVCGVGAGGAAAAPAPAPPAPAPVAAHGRYAWPLSARPRVVRAFDPPAKRWLAGHRGVDLAAPAGSLVLSAGAGVVNFAGRVAGKPVVSVRHPDGIVTTYEPVVAGVTAGDRVIRGSPLGTVAAGHVGCSASCLHWGARRGSGSRAVYLDPRALVGGIRVRLKPVDGAPSLSVTGQARG